MTVVQDQLKDS